MYVPYDVGVKFFKTVEWNWFTAAGSTATISVPADATPGVHSAFVTTSYDGVESLVPVAVNVPVTVGVPFDDVADVGHKVSYFNEGDWKYYSMPSAGRRIDGRPDHGGHLDRLQHRHRPVPDQPVRSGRS